MGVTVLGPNEIAQLEAGVIPGPKPVVLVTCGDPKRPNIITIGYFTQISDKTMAIGVRPSRHSYHLIEQNKWFTINYITTELMWEADYCGVVSGKDLDKFEATGLTKEVSKTGNILISESPLSIECQLGDVINTPHHGIFIGTVKMITTRVSGYDPCADWLYIDCLDYIGKEGIIGRVFQEWRRKAPQLNF